MCLCNTVLNGGFGKFISFVKATFFSEYLCHFKVQSSIIRPISQGIKKQRPSFSFSICN